jgi:hypothetical protein
LSLKLFPPALKTRHGTAWRACPKRLSERSGFFANKYAGQ